MFYLQALAELNADRNGFIAFDDFAAWWNGKDKHRLLERRDSSRMINAVSMFRKYDKDNNGFVIASTHMNIRNTHAHIHSLSFSVCVCVCVFLSFFHALVKPYFFSFITPLLPLGDHLFVPISTSQRMNDLIMIVFFTSSVYNWLQFY